ncbi:MAG: leucine-rich repeat protein [Bacilli bacterium]|nr:leucine-rich repeat protein [Bacilli bacterium]
MKPPMDFAKESFDEDDEHSSKGSFMDKCAELFQKIDQSKSIAELYALDAIPPINFAGEFFFISYSHGDYKAIYKDIFAFQERGLAIWFDRGMKPGTDWLENAEHFVSQFACKGIIIYLSALSLKSQAVLEEIRLASTYRKPLIPIVLQKDALLDGDIVKTFQANLKLNEEDTALVEKAFGKRILYLEGDSPVESKMNYVQNARDETKLLNIIDIDDKTSIHLLNSRSMARGKMLAQCNDPYCVRVNLPVEVAYIGDATFTNMMNLKEIDLSKVVEIDSHAFADCRQLHEVDLRSIVHLGDSAFERSGVARIYFPHVATLSERMAQADSIDLAKTYEEDENAKFEEDLKTVMEEWLVPDDSATGEGERVIPNEEQHSIQMHLGKNAFAYCNELERLELVETFPEISEGCFHDCQNLREVVLDGPTVIGPCAFYNCTNLSKVTFKGNDVHLKRSANGLPTNLDVLLYKEKLIRVVGDSAFENCTGLTDFSLPPSCDEIGARAFKGSSLSQERLEICGHIKEQAFMNSAIRSIRFAGRETTIPDEVCRGCKNLEKVEIIQADMDVGNSSFRDCPNLRFVKVPSTNIRKSAFSHSGVATIELQDTVRTIGEYAFSNCRYLNCFWIHSEDLTIQARAFYQCGWIKYLVLPERGTIRFDVRALEEAGFEHVLYMGSEEQYKQGHLKIEFTFEENPNASHVGFSEEDEREYQEERAKARVELEAKIKESFGKTYFHASYYFVEPGKNWDFWRSEGVPKVYLPGE